MSQVAASALRRLAVATAVAVSFVALTFVPSTAAAATSPAVPTTIASKEDARTAQLRSGSRSANHVRALSRAQVAQIENKAGPGLSIIGTEEGRASVVWQRPSGELYGMVVADAVLQSGRAVVGFAIRRLDTRPSGRATHFGVAAAEAATSVQVGFIPNCSWVTQNNDGSVSVHICPPEVGVIAAMLAFQIALVGIVLGGVIGAMVGAFLGLLAAIWLASMMNPDGSIDLYIPAWTIWPPPGGSAYASGGQYLWYQDQCSLWWDGGYYRPSTYYC